jgi:hypothetical protein
MNSLPPPDTGTPDLGRYNQVYDVLVHAWPQLAKVDKDTRSNAIWLFESSEIVVAWLATLSQKERDQWNHPKTIRRHYENRHPHLLPAKASPPNWPRPPRQARSWNQQPLGERSREDLEAIIAEQDTLIADRDREILDKEVLLEEQNRRIAQLEQDLAWERQTRRQLEAVAAPAAATVVRPDGSVEIVHAVTRESQEVSPPLNHGQPDYVAWAKRLIAPRIGKLSVLELDWLLADNRAHFDAYETAFPGAGVALKDRVNARIAELAFAPV